MKTAKEKDKYFDETLAQVNAPEHPNLQYFIYKSIILNNLYGVDIMNEAVEIAKLRLFLKLVATVDVDYSKQNLGLEPLPDVDFNIRAGNTLVGYAMEDALKNSLATDLIAKLDLPRIEDQCDIVARAFTRYKEIQLQGHADFEDFKTAKDDLNDRLDKLRNELDKLLHKQHYGNVKYDKWLTTHQPFHWFAEFYEIIHGKGGFDVVIGNPPYLEYSKAQSDYRVLQVETMPTNNLYAFVSERSRKLVHSCGYVGLILPNSSVSAEKMQTLQKIFQRSSVCWISSYAWRPSKLFDGANMLLAIWIVRQAQEERCFVTRYHRWHGEFRDFLFLTLQYIEATNHVAPFRIPKLPDELAVTILDKCRKSAKGKSLLASVSGSSHTLYYFRAVLYWFKVLVKPPIMEEDGVQTPTGEMKDLSFANKNDRDAALSLMASNLFALNYVIWSSCQVVNSPDLMFPISLTETTKAYGEELSSLAMRLMKDAQARSTLQTREYSSHGRRFTMRKQYFYFKESKPIINEIDKVLAEHYGFTHEELDFIINYDIKYRMGKELGNGEDEE